MLSLIGFIITIMLLVFVHEFGHYWVAKKCGVKIEQFSIGFGKAIYSRQDAEGTEWRLGFIPLGGYVKMHGDSDPASINRALVKEPIKAFYTKPLWQRFAIVAAGPIANYLLAIVILAIFFFAFGKSFVPAVIDEVIANSPAAMADLRADDTILAVDGRKITEFAQLQKIIMLSTGQPLQLLIDRAGATIAIKVTPTRQIFAADNTKNQASFIGIKAGRNVECISMGLMASIASAIQETVEISVLTLKAFGQIIVGTRSAGEIHGPLTIAKESGKSINAGMLSFALFIAMLSINLGLINLLPIPILDGGHLALLIFEGVARKPLRAEHQNLLLKIGGSILVFLIVISALNDIKSLIF